MISNRTLHKVNNPGDASDACPAVTETESAVRISKMAARIVYHGGVGGGGDLFQGMKIWLSLRVPLRKTYKEQVESNGGEIVLLEKNADVIIVDHARKDCPPGSISWRWIEQSVKKGVLEDIEDHRAGPIHAQVREVGSTQSTKKTKTPFTTADDNILMQWVTKAERKGRPILGNAIYQELAQKYPHHTPQSWMDRWKRYVSLRKRPDENEDEDETEEDKPESVPAPLKRRQPRYAPSGPPPPIQSTPAPSIPPPPKIPPIQRPKPPTQASVASPVASEKSHNSTKSLKAGPFVLKSVGGDVFTNAESKLLLDAYDEIMNISPDQIIDAWMAWSMEHSNHTPQEWRNHFNEYVVPTKEARLTSKKASRQIRETPQPQQVQKRDSVPKTNITDMSPPGQIQTRQPAPKRSIDISVRSRGSEIKDSQESSGQMIQSPKKPVESAEVDDELLSYTGTLEEFEKSLLLLADSLQLEVDPNPVIRDRTVPLYDLWQTVQLDEFGGYDNVTGMRLWRRVARELGYVEDQAEAGRELQGCYSEILCDLEDFLRQLQEGEDLTSSQEEELIADQLQQDQQTEEQTGEQEDTQDGEEELYRQDPEAEELLDDNDEHEELLREQEENDDDLNFVQMSPPRPQSSATSTGKRRLGGLRSSDLSYNKRQRIDKGKGKERLEIPSTPEDVINSTQMSRPAQQPSPLKHSQAEPPSSSASSPIQEVRPIKLDMERPIVRQRHLEPETQDFYHPASQSPQRPSDIDDDDDDDVDSLGSIPGPPEIDMEKHSNAEVMQQDSPSPPVQSPLQNVSNTTTRGTFQSSSNYDSSTQSQSDSQIQENLKAWVAKQVSDGYAQDIVIQAMLSGSFSLQEAMIVLNSLADGEGIPEDVPGVWTSKDDDALTLGRETDEYQRVLFKHGISRIHKRRVVLRDIRASEEADEEET
ncbi:hypothetical protein VTL71DRAFT_14108 [Oculimacula yallundae]|uniref:DNA-binding protein RAP1 n=1 Tax=Oculimacula yallundae TaxID=86028 RepID=A0ABR4CHI8_9HELO